MYDGVARTASTGDEELPTLTDRSWMERALESSSDPVYVLDAATRVTWINTAGAQLVGLTRSEALGHSIAEFVHPDDLIRAAEVLGLASQGVFDALPITPALYRIRDARGDWISLGVNASLPQPDGSVLIVARVGGDLVIADRLLEAVTGNAPFDHQVALVLELAMWRHPLEGYAIAYDDGGTRRAITSPDLDPELRGDRDLDGPTPWNAAVTTGTDVVISDLTAADAIHPHVGPALAASAVRAGYVGCLAAPVRDATGLRDACIIIWTTERGPTNAGHRYALDNMRRALTLVLQQRTQRLLLERAARVDALTGLLTRAGFFEVLESETHGLLADGFSVLYIDLDGFKAVNDSYGHGIGDHVLVAGVRRILDVAPSDVIAGRLGGDEFVLVCPATSSPEMVEQLADQIVTRLQIPIETPAETVAIGASIGVASGRPGDDTQQILELADAALLDAKAAGRSRWVAH